MHVIVPPESLSAPPFEGAKLVPEMFALGGSRCLGRTTTRLVQGVQIIGERLVGNTLSNIQKYILESEIYIYTKRIGSS